MRNVFLMSSVALNELKFILPGLSGIIMFLNQLIRCAPLHQNQSYVTDDHKSSHLSSCLYGDQRSALSP